MGLPQSGDLLLRKASPDPQNPPRTKKNLGKRQTSLRAEKNSFPDLSLPKASSSWNRVSLEEQQQDGDARPLGTSHPVFTAREMQPLRLPNSEQGPSVSHLEHGNVRSAKTDEK